MRSHYCGQITEYLVGQKIALCGWVNRIRDHGKLIFIDLRDYKGIVQIVVNEADKAAFKLAATLHNEDVLKIIGTVHNRPENLVNQDILTGKIEVTVTELQILNKAEPLPFSITENQEVNEELRLRYRYLDLRRPETARKIIMRSAIVRSIRNFLDNLDFLDIETPILTKSTPEGARDYLVPSRIHKGKFYALPQSPQVFKQLLMAAGFDRYYQIARCFRDEDLRADRQPEFTQLDMELAFTDELEIQTIIEEMFKKLFSEVLNTELKLPFLRLTYAEALSRYGSDRPDLRIPLEIVDISSVVKTTDFAIFKQCLTTPGNKVAALRFPGGAKLSRKQLDEYNQFVTKYGAKGLLNIKVNDKQAGTSGLQSSLTKFLSAETLTNILQYTQAETGDVIFIVADTTKTVNDALGALRIKLGHDHKLIDKSKWAFAWIVDFPMFEEKDNRITFVHHPFTAPRIANLDELSTNPLAIKARTYDLVLNGYELGGGSIRICDINTQLAVFNVLGIDATKAQRDFGHLLEALKYGYPPEGGIAFGLDRIAMLMAGGTSLREVIAFPKTQSAYCPLTDAPSTVAEQQLKDIGLQQCLHTTKTTTQENNQ